jgi:hypothetical protein
MATVPLQGWLITKMLYMSESVVKPKAVPRPPQTSCEQPFSIHIWALKEQDASDVIELIKTELIPAVYGEEELPIDEDLSEDCVADILSLQKNTVKVTFGELSLCCVNDDADNPFQMRGTRSF